MSSMSSTTEGQGFADSRHPFGARAGLKGSERLPRRDASVQEGQKDKSTQSRRWPPLPVMAFFVAMLIPWQIYLGPLHLSMTRAVLLITLVPALVRWASGKAGKIYMPDIAVLLFIAWCGVATVQVEGANYAVQSVGMLTIETAGAYFLARTYIRNEQDFLAMCKGLFLIVAFLMPFALIESMSSSAVLLKFFGNFVPVYEIAGSDPRWGMRRAQTVFQHPILFGVFCGVAFAPTFLVLGYAKPALTRWFKTAIVVAAAFFSLSSGPMTALALQIALVAWNWAFRGFPGRWKLLWAILGSAYLFVSIFSRQSPAQHLINLVAFDKGSAWQRLLIWNYGTESIASHPLFGVGFGDWARMEGQTSSVDMFWIISSLRHGLLAGVFLALIYLGSAWMVGMRKGLTASQLQCRTAYLIALAGFFVAGWTVDFWGEVYTAFFFIIGSGLWLLNEPSQAEGADIVLAEPSRSGVRRYSRTLYLKPERVLPKRRG